MIFKRFLVCLLRRVIELFLLNRYLDLLFLLRRPLDLLFLRRLNNTLFLLRRMKLLHWLRRLNPFFLLNRLNSTTFLQLHRLTRLPLPSSNTLTDPPNNTRRMLRKILITQWRRTRNQKGRKEMMTQQSHILLVVVLPFCPFIRLEGGRCSIGYYFDIQVLGNNVISTSKTSMTTTTSLLSFQ